MARKKSFGSPPKAHRKSAVEWANAYRLERKVVLQHLAAGECYGAVRGLSMAAYAFGNAHGHREGLSKTRQAKGRFRPGNAPASPIFDLATKVANRCKLK